MASQTMTRPPAGWLPDPGRRHEYRYFDGSNWTDAVSDHGQIGHEVLAAPHVRAPVPASELGSFGTKWMKIDTIVLPRRCVACGADDAFDSMKVGGNDWTGKIMVSLQMPLCAECQELLVACGLKRGDGGGGWICSRRAPEELRDQFKQIIDSVKFGVKRMGFSTGLRFTFTNRRFAEAFQLANPGKKHR